MGKKGPVLELEQDSPLLCLPEFHVGMVVLTAYPLPCLKSRKCHGGPCCPHCGCAHHGSHAAT